METRPGAAVRAAALALPLLITGCARIYFHNGENVPAEPPPPRFHHIGVFGLVEFSEPVDLKSGCQSNDWATVVTMNTFVTGLVAGLTWSLYTPWGVSFNCK